MTKEDIPEYLEPLYDKLVSKGLIERKLGPMGSFDVMSDEAFKKLSDAQYEYNQEQYKKSVIERKKESGDDNRNEK